MATCTFVLNTRWGVMPCGTTEYGLVFSWYPGRWMGAPSNISPRRNQVYQALIEAHQETDRVRRDWCDRLGGMMDAYLDGLRTDPADVPVDYGFLASSGYSPFAIHVYQACRGIPRGETMSYAKIAREIGKPRSFRAVGRALGANPLAILVPCHRVVRSSGTPGGYAWGVGEKMRLLRLEGALR